MKKSKKGKFLKVLAMPALLLCAGLSLTACGEPAHTHDFQTNYSCNQTHHWHDCSGCEEEKDKALHIDEDNNDFCDVCNYEMAHTHHQFANTWSSDATKHWKECACGEKSQEANHAHNTWQNNETQHWQQCECGHTTTPANHNWGTGIVTTQPQYGVPGERTFTCECGKTKTEAIPALTKPAAVINGMNEINLDKEYDGNVVLAPATLTDTNTDAGSDITFEWYQGATKLATAPKDAGTYIFKAIVAETANFARVEEGKQFTISAKEITVNWTAPANLEYSRTEKMASATAVGLCGADTATIDVTPENNNINPGPVTFTAVSQNPNYVVRTTGNANKKTYTIAPKTLTNVVIVKEYDGDAGNGGYISLSAQLNESHGVFEGDSVYVSITSVTGIVPMGNGNNWVINTPTTASVVGTHASYYSIAPSEVKLQRIPKKITISSSNLNFDYTGSTTFTYTLTEFDGLINSALGENYNGGTVEFTVANANVSAGAQTPTQIGFTDYGCTGLVLVNGYYLYQIVNTPTVTINKGIYTDDFQFYTAEYNGSTTLDFEISTSSGKIYLTGDVANKNVTGDYQDITNIRLTQGTELPNNYRDVSVADGQIRIGKRQLTIIYETVYTGSEITIPTLTRQNSTMNGLIAGEEVQITNIQFEDAEDKINVGAPVVGGIVDYQPKSLKDGFTLAGDDCDNYNLSSGHLYVVITPIELTNLDTAITKVYDCNNVIDVTLSASDGILPADVSKGYTIRCTVDSKNAGTRQVLSSTLQQTGCNYKIADDYAQTATITKKTLTGVPMLDMTTLYITEDRVYEENGNWYFNYRFTTECGVIDGDNVTLQLKLSEYSENQELTTGLFMGTYSASYKRSGDDVLNYDFSDIYGSGVCKFVVCKELTGKITLRPTLNEEHYDVYLNNPIVDTSELVGYIANTACPLNVGRVQGNTSAGEILNPNRFTSYVQGGVQYNFMFARDIEIVLDWSNLSE